MQEGSPNTLPLYPETGEVPVHEAESSLDTTKKLDRLIFLLEGAGENAPGLIQRINTHEVLLMGREGEGGLAHRVNVMWRAHMWLLCTMSGLAGFWLKAGIEHIIK